MTDQPYGVGYPLISRLKQLPFCYINAPVDTTNFFFHLLTHPALRFRLIRHGVLWATVLLLMYRGFQYIGQQIPDPGAQQTYAIWATLVFGGLTLATYGLVIWLTHRFVLRRFQINYFLSSLAGVHVIATALVREHFLLFAHYLGLPHLPRMYTVYNDHVRELTFWQVPFDAIIVGLFSFSLFYNYVLYAVGLKVFKDLFGLKLEQTRLETENLQLEFNFLKAQINPHFLFNTLNNIYSFSIQAPERVPGTILTLAELMRYALYETEAQQVPLTKELAFLDSYVQLQRIRHEADMELSYTVQGQAGTLLIPPLLLIVFVENAFKHGPQATTQGGRVRIDLTIKESSLWFQVENNVPSKAVTTTGGIGLINVRKRLDYFFHKRYHLDIQEAATIYRVNLQLQLHEPALPSYHRG